MPSLDEIYTLDFAMMTDQQVLQLLLTTEDVKENMVSLQLHFTATMKELARLVDSHHCKQTKFKHVFLDTKSFFFMLNDVWLKRIGETYVLKVRKQSHEIDHAVAYTEEGNLTREDYFTRVEET